MLTNGSLFTDELVQDFADFGTYVRVSLEASNVEAYVEYKRVATREWFRVLDNVQDLVHAKRDANSLLDVGLKFGVGKSLRGRSHYEAGIALGLRLGVSNVQFKSLRHAPEELSDAELEREERELALVRLQFKGDMPVIAALRRKHAVPQCWLSPLHTVIDAHGDVYPCCYYYYRDRAFCIGNVLERSFSDVWYNDAHAAALSAIRREDCARVDCKFFGHHETVASAFANNRIDFL